MSALYEIYKLKVRVRELTAQLEAVEKSQKAWIERLGALEKRCRTLP